MTSTMGRSYRLRPLSEALSWCMWTATVLNSNRWSKCYCNSNWLSFW